MRQILCSSSGAMVVRVPRPVVRDGCVLIRVKHSLISTGTEIASLRPDPTLSGQQGKLEMVKAYASLARLYLGLAIRYPDKAVIRACQIAAGQAARLFPKKPAAPKQVAGLDGLSWTTSGAKEFSCAGGSITCLTDASEFGYQAQSCPIPVSEGMAPAFVLRGKVAEGAVCIGLLSESGDAWLGSRTYEAGDIDDELVFDPAGSKSVTLVIANAGTRRPSRLVLAELGALEVPRDGLPVSEMNDQGWNVGYSASGEVVAVGRGVTGFSPGDLVACGGAGLANHAEWVCVPMNLVCRVPGGCQARDAATATVGTIAMQGVRRADIRLGERVVVLGLGLIGQMTAQLARASGAYVLGLDLDAARVERALSLGMDAGASDADKFRLLVREATGGKGADAVIITAATKSDAVINLSMELCRAKGRVIIVGDVGLNVQRAQFYRKEIDLLMSTSYGPGRYDRAYEAEGRDYPYAYVRWTQNRNMGAYLEAVASGRMRVGELIDLVIAVDKAPEAYAELAQGQGSLPLAVIIDYPDDTRPLPEPADSPRIRLRGHKKAPADRQILRYALVGAGAFGTCMLVPQMAKRKERFFLKAVVSADAVRGGNFARTSQVEVFTSDLAEVLADPDIDLVVIATRHDQHARQTIQALTAGKHVFVEKPLCLTWEELDAIAKTYAALEIKPLLMAGFNRRFSPALEMLRGELAGRGSPLIVNYRLNGGYIPPEHWIQGPEGGGRNLGEACHMYDVFASLAGAEVTGITAQAIRPSGGSWLKNDNFCASLAYADGSVGNLVYTALGPKQGLPKERIEVFCDGQAWIVDDYKKLTRATDGAILWEAAEADKGHFEELSRFGNAIVDGLEAPIPFAQIIETSAAALRVEDLIQGVASLDD